MADDQAVKPSAPVPGLALSRYRFRATLRARWTGFVTIILLVGLVGGLALGALAAARRTQSAFPRYLATSASSDLEFSAYAPQGGISQDLYSPTLTNRLARLPDVQSLGGMVTVFLAPADRQGQPIANAALVGTKVQEVAGVNGEFTRLDRPVATQGRLADPHSLNQVMVTQAAAALLHWHVGQVIPLVGYSLAQMFAQTSGFPSSPPVVRVRATVVGIVTFPGTVVQDEVDRYPVRVVFSPALAAKLVSDRAAGFTIYSIKLRHGASDVARAEREITADLPPISTYTFHLTSVVETDVQQAIDPEVYALAVFGAIAALAALIIGAQACSRTIGATSREAEVLRALGARPQTVMLDSVGGVLLSVVIAGLVAAVVAVLLSPLAPLGAVRAVDPYAGYSSDWTVLGLGVAGFVVLLTLFSVLVVAARNSTARRSFRSIGAGSRWQASSAAARANLPPTTLNGIRFALDRGGDPRQSVPVGPALLGAALAVTVIVATLTFGNSLRTLVSHPNLYGWNWDYAVEQQAGGAVPGAFTSLLSRTDDVAAWNGYHFANPTLDGQSVPVLLLNRNAAVAPPLLSGQPVEATDQIVLGATTLAALHKKVGDTVTVTYGSPRTTPVYVPPTTLHIVGTATLPTIGNSGSLHPSMGTGAEMSISIEPAAMARALHSPDPNQNGPDAVVIRLRPGVTAQKGAAALERDLRAANKILARDAQNVSPLFLLPVQQPAQIVNYKTMGAAPAYLAIGLGAGAVIALALTLMASVRRRRRDLALLRTLGLVPRQLAAVVSWQASVIALVGVAIGIPVGIAAGRSIWDLFAHVINAVPQPSVPLLAVVLTGVGTVVVANVVALVPGWLAARTRTASLLRAE